MIDTPALFALADEIDEGGLVASEAACLIRERATSTVPDFECKPGETITSELSAANFIAGYPNEPF